MKKYDLKEIIIELTYEDAPDLCITSPDISKAKDLIKEKLIPGLIAIIEFKYVCLSENGLFYNLKYI